MKEKMIKILSGVALVVGVCVLVGGGLYWDYQCYQDVGWLCWIRGR